MLLYLYNMFILAKRPFPVDRGGHNRLASTYLRIRGPGFRFYVCMGYSGSLLRAELFLHRNLIISKESIMVNHKKPCFQQGLIVRGDYAAGGGGGEMFTVQAN